MVFSFGGLGGAKKVLFELVVGIVGVILVFAIVQYILANYLQIEVSMVNDVWDAMKEIPQALGDAAYNVLTAIGEFLASPFKAFANTLMAAGLPVNIARFIAIAIISLVMAGVIFGIGKWRGWF